jgi:predicted aspartyl protease
MLKMGLLIALFAVLAGQAQAAQFDKQIPMRVTKASTFYVGGYLDGYGAVDMMVDTGSSYMTINESALEVLRDNGAATYVKDLTGIMADGTRKVVPIYRISNMSIGKGCSLHDVEAAVFPGHTRYILGLSALKLAAPFALSIEPPTLMLSNCVDGTALRKPESSGAANAVHALSLNAESVGDGQVISQ